APRMLVSRRNCLIAPQLVGSVRLRVATDLNLRASCQEDRSMLQRDLARVQSRVWHVMFASCARVQPRRAQGPRSKLPDKPEPLLVFPQEVVPGVEAYR